MKIQGELYYSPECPHCEKVLAFMDANDLQITKHDVDMPGVAEEMVERTGANGWPTLILPNGEFIQGDTPIINYLELQL